MTLLEAMHNRFSVRDFSDKPVEQEKIDKILEAGRIAPTAKNNQPQKIFVLKSKEAVEKISGVSPCIYQAPLVFMIGYDEERIWKSATGDGRHSGDVDASIVCTHMMLEAYEQGLGSCWVARFDENDAKKAFSLPENIHVVALLPVGYPTEKGSVPSDRHTQYREDFDYIEEL